MAEETTVTPRYTWLCTDCLTELVRREVPEDENGSARAEYVCPTCDEVRACVWGSA